jgi:hypothetical protein
MDRRTGPGVAFPQMRYWAHAGSVTITAVTVVAFGTVVAFALVVLSALGMVQPAHAADPWRKLHRPLHLPRLAAGETCPVSHIDPRVDWGRVNMFGGPGLGPGPVYPGLGDERHLTTTGRSRDGRFETKVFWYVKPSYRGRALIRGRRLDGPGRLHFVRGRHTDGLPRELHITRHEIHSWTGDPPPGSRGVPSGLSIRSSGCYGVQIDGTRFSRTVVFTASTP